MQQLLESHIIILWIGLVGTMTFRYLAFSIIPYSYFYQFAFKRWKKSFIQNKLPSKDMIKYEIKYSLISVVVIALVSACLFKLGKMGYTKVYFNIDKHGYGYIALTTLILILYWDVYYYFSHRLFHTDFFYKRFHYVHHKNSRPTPFAALAFHPVEAFVSSFFFVGICFVIEIHPSSYVAFLIYMSSINTVGHLGVEIMPQWMIRMRLYKVLNFVAHHNQHHQYYHCNYGILFNFFDRFFGTNHENYDKYYESLIENNKQRIGERHAYLHEGSQQKLQGHQVQ